MRTRVADRARARTEWPALSAAWTVARPIPLLAPTIRMAPIGMNTPFEFPLGRLHARFASRAASLGGTLEGGLRLACLRSPTCFLSLAERSRDYNKLQTLCWGAA